MVPGRRARLRADGTGAGEDGGKARARLAAQVGLDADVEVVATCGSDGRRVVVDGVGTPIDCTVAAVGDPSDSAAVVAVAEPDGRVVVELA